MRNDIATFWFLGYKSDIRVELQAPMCIAPMSTPLGVHLLSFATLRKASTWSDQIKANEISLKFETSV